MYKYLFLLSADFSSVVLLEGYKWNLIAVNAVPLVLFLYMYVYREIYISTQIRCLKY